MEEYMDAKRLKCGIGQYLKYCANYNCSSVQIRNVKNSIKFHAFPRNKKLCNIWLIKSGRVDLKLKKCYENGLYKYSSYKLCSLHFQDDQYVTPFRLKLKKDAIPNTFQNSGKENEDPEVSSITEDRFASLDFIKPVEGHFNNNHSTENLNQDFELSTSDRRTCNENLKTPPFSCGQIITGQRSEIGENFIQYSEMSSLGQRAYDGNLNSPQYLCHLCGQFITNQSFDDDVELSHNCEMSTSPQCMDNTDLKAIPNLWPKLWETLLHIAEKEHQSDSSCMVTSPASKISEHIFVDIVLGSTV